MGLSDIFDWVSDSGVMDWVSPVASVVGAFMGKSEADKATSQSSQALTASTATANELMMDWLVKNRADIAKAVEAGQLDLDTAFTQALQRLDKFIDVDKVNEARDLATGATPLSSNPQNQFQRSEANKTTSSLLGKSASGKVDKISQAANEYGRNFASTFLDETINRYIPLVNRSFGASVGSANLAAGLGRAKADVGMGGSAMVSQATGQTLPVVARGVNQISQIGAEAGINRYNNRVNLLSDLLNVGNQTLALLSNKS